MKKFFVYICLVLGLSLALSSPLLLAQESEIFKEIKEKIDSAKSTLGKSLVDTSLLEKRLSEVDDKVASLEEQLKGLDDQLSDTESRLVILLNQIEKSQDQLELIREEITKLVKDIEEQKLKLGGLMSAIYIENDAAGFFDDDDLQTLKLLLNDQDVDETLRRNDSLKLLEFSLSDLIYSLVDRRKEFEVKKSELEDKIQELNDLKEDVDSERVYLELQKDAKVKLLEATRGEEKVYRELIERAKQEQVQIRKDINDLMVEYTKYEARFGKDGFGLDNFGTTSLDDKLSWPVNPRLGISAYFRDSTYKAALGVEHNAIDIRTAMQTPIHSPADGVVLKVKGGEGIDYHYIIVAHNGNVMTLYGHVNEELVSEGQQINRGDIIGLSGGMPGSRGAGWLTTGPHLHFEVFNKGVHVNPLDYLDLRDVPASIELK